MLFLAGSQTTDLGHPEVEDDMTWETAAGAGSTGCRRVHSTRCSTLSGHLSGHECCINLQQANTEFIFSFRFNQLLGREGRLAQW